MESVGRSGAPVAGEPERAPKSRKESSESADKQEQDAFENAMKGDKADERGGQPQLTGGPLTDLPGMLSAIGRGGQDTPAADAALVTSAAVPESLQTVDKVADRILVATPPPGSDRQEVRITLKEGVLPETDIQIVREGESVSVTFRTENSDANHFLSAHRAGLEERLNERLNVKVNVSLDHQEQDGRSRGQRNLYEEMEDDR